MTSDSRIAIVHERLTEIAGSENVVEQLALQWPDAQVYVAIARPEGVPHGLSHPPSTTWLEKPYDAIGRRSYAPLMPLMPWAFRHLKLPDVDAVIASHHAFAVQSVFATKLPVIAYVHSPARWAWDSTMRSGEGGGQLGASILTALAAITRRGERTAAPRLRAVIANSRFVAGRIKQWWGCDAAVVHPPVDTDYYTPDATVEREDFFLLAGRLVPYKRPELAVIAATKADVPLVVVGTGRALELCRSVAGPKVTFLGRVSQEKLLELHRRARAELMPGVEDFGIVPVEAMATGTPVIAVNAGGALETVIPGLSGLHVRAGTDQEVIEGFVNAIRTFEAAAFDHGQIRTWAEGFSQANFRNTMREFIHATV